jgi:predicted anti-sigma-YlaC factor YlaD
MNTFDKTKLGIAGFVFGVLLGLAVSVGFGISTAEDWSFAPDKQFHAGASAVATGILLAEPTYKPPVDMAIVMVLGVAKEIADTRKPGGYFSLADLSYDTLGIMLSYITYEFLTVRW